MRFCRERNLEDLCLRTIAFNFDKFYSHIALWERYNNFLKRRYSDRIYKIFKKAGLPDEKLTEWLISPYWSTLTIGKTHSVSNLVPKFKCLGSELTSVSLESSLTTVKILSAVICLLPNVEYLNLNGTSCTDDVLSLIRKMCPSLKSLSLYGCNVTDNGMKNLCFLNEEKIGFDSLEVLNIRRTKVNSKGIVCILKNLNLHVIEYPDFAIAFYLIHISFAKIPKIHSLKELQFSTNIFDTTVATVSFNSVLKVWSELCPGVEKLTVADLVSECDFDLWLKFQNLKSLSFSAMPDLGNPSKGSLASFLEMRGEKLTELDLENVSITAEVIGRTCFNLQKLTMSNIKYIDFDEACVSDKVHHLNSLVKLAIKYACMYERSTYKSVNLLLSISKNAESVSFHCARNVSEMLIDNLIDMENLVKAKFVFTDIKDANALRLFSDCKNLRLLYFDGCPYIPVEHWANKVFSGKNHTGNTHSWRIDYDENLYEYEEIT